MLKNFKAKVLLILVFLVFYFLFKPIEKLHYVFQSNGAIQPITSKLQRVVYQSADVEIRQIDLVRQNNAPLSDFVNELNKPKLYFFKFKKNDHNFKVSLDKQGNTTGDLVKGNTIFAINSSFYDKELQSLGEVVVDGQSKGHASRSSGFFKVINGKAVAGPKSIFSGLDDQVEYACQAHPSVMKDGHIWSYILNEDQQIAAWKRLTYRNLCGMDADGNICFLVSADGGLLSVKEIAEIADQLGVKTATLLDAGVALQYCFDDGDYYLSFYTYNNVINLGHKFDELFISMTKKRFFNSSPVFINYQRSSE
ncbi:phosphodiester glycosidase family protein [Persicobacter psychrovividus]|uniref:Phosphodiester glycosidase domain-containing protein n=1 Tax=Persicobacter psychrovividus TaxID=387638 RepID=A0ABN6L7B3_9BACT|nr:hypothetical protein PEPS_13880 [Persicobacter psychrovividus]